MIEIGKDRTLARGSRRAGSLMDFVAGILVLAWLARGIVGITPYSETLLFVALFGFGLLGDVFKTDTTRGPVRAVSSLFARVAWWAVTTVILIWILGWIAGLQSDVLQPVFYSLIPDLAITALFLGLVAAATWQAGPSLRKLRATAPPILLKSASQVRLEQTMVSTKGDSIGLPIRKSRRTVGCVVVGDVKAEFDTPMGTVSAMITGPVTSFGIPFRGERASGGQVRGMTGLGLDELIRQTKVETSMVGEAEIEVDLPPFVHVRRDEFQDSVDVGPLSIRSGPKGQVVKIGPISIDADEQSDRWFSRRYWGSHGRFSTWWSLKGAGDWSYISSSGDGVKARWNGSSLELKGGSMKLKVGSDGFSYSPHELETFTPLHTLRVTQEKVTLNTKRFTLDIVGTTVMLRTEDGSKKTESGQLAGDLRTLLADTAKKQVSDVLEGQPIELDEMLSGTEELLKKYD